MTGQLVRRTPSPRGLLRPFDLRLPGAPLLHRETSPVPSGAVALSLLAVTPSYRLAAFLDRGDKMPRIRFYNRRSRHEHPPETPASETARRAPWETRRRSTSRPLSLVGLRLVVRAAPDHLAVIRPPTATRLTACLPASGLSTTFFSQGLSRPAPARLSPPRRRSARALSAQGASVDSNPLTPLDGAWIEIRAHTRLCPSRLTLLPPGHVNAPGSTESRCLPSWETCTGALSSLGVARCSRLAGQGSCRTFSSRSDDRD